MSRYVAACCVVTGIPRLLSLAEPEDGPVAWSEHGRTPSRGKASVRTVRQCISDEGASSARVA